MSLTMRNALFIMMFLVGSWIFTFSTNTAQFPHAHAQGLTPEERARLEGELAEIEAEIAVQRRFLEEKQRESVSLERDLSILDAQIARAQLSIRARNIAIQNLSNEIEIMGITVEELDKKIDREKESLAQLIRRTDEADDVSLVEILLNSENFSEFFQDIDSYHSIKDGLYQSFAVIEESRVTILNEQATLEEKRLEEQQLREVQLLERQSIERDEAEKRRILEETRGEEQAYQSMITSKEQDAAAIRSALFEIRDSAPIPFGQAFEYAKAASEGTGVRPAFILGIIATESRLGENLGSGNWKEDMHPTRDQPVFKEITDRLGLDPDTLPVSKKPWYGWGGAMGPSQFIPSTWVMYEDKIAEITGNNPPNPWNPRDAFTASALLLRDNGAARGGIAAERLAALRYLAGWVNAEKPEYAFYADDVMRHTAEYQRQIDILQGN